MSLTTALVACGKKRKRAIFDNPDTGEILELTPSKPSQDNLKDDFDEIDLDGTVDQLLQGEEVIDWYEHNSANFFQDEREPRFVNLGFTWSTTTSTKKKTTTSYTATSTMGSIICTPSGWTVPGCG